MKLSLAASSLLLLWATGATAADEDVEGVFGGCLPPVVKGICATIGLLSDLNDAVKVLPSEDPNNASLMIQQTFLKDNQGLEFVAIRHGASLADGDGVCLEAFGPNFGAVIAEQTEVACDPETNIATFEIYLSDERLEGKMDDIDEYEINIPSECDLQSHIPMEVCTLVYEVACGCEAEDEEEGEDARRRLDASLEDVVAPTERPTKSPTGAPTSKPTDRPSISLEPTASPAPTHVGAPQCEELVTIPPDFEGELPFCYDGNGYNGFGGNGKAYTTCFVVDVSEYCGVADFMIEGVNELDNYRCSDVIDWFHRCVDSYGCEPAHDPHARFTYGNPSVRRVTYYRSRNNEPEYYEFMLDGAVINGAFKWKCPDRESAFGMKHFADAIWRTRAPGSSWRRLFQTPVGVCESAAPSLSLVPTSSPAPSLPVSIDCKAELGYHYPYSKPFTRDYFNRNDNGPNGKNWLKVNKRCEYSITGAGTASGGEFFDYPEQWVNRLGELWGATLLDNGAEFIGTEGMPKNDVVYATCGDNHCVYFRQGTGVRNADKTFVFGSDARTFAIRFKNLFGRAASDTWGRSFKTSDENNRCGVSPFCFDDKGYATCYADPESENCASQDFLVKSPGDTEPQRTSDIFEFFQNCANTWPSCSYDEALSSTGKWVYGKKPGLGSWTSGGQRYVRWRGGGMKGQFIWRCDDIEQGREMAKFGTDLRNTELVRTKTTVCTETPTESPTACQDSFLSRFPLNIVVVIDISYSTYETPFSGSYIGDLNDDDKKNSILDAEISAVIQMLKVIESSEELNNDNVDIGVVVFETSGSYKGEYMPQGRYAPLNEAGDGINQQLVDDLKKIKTLDNDYDVVYQNRGFTNFDDALDKSITYFEEREASLGAGFDDWTNLMVFLSDGVPNIRGDGDDEDWCATTEADCSAAPANLANNDPARPWLDDSLSFCLSGDGNCAENPFKTCASGPTCEGDSAVTQFDSEFAKLDSFGPNGVMRIAIGVGAGSDVSQGSALYKIDNNPYKATFPDLLPPQVFTTDDLANLLRNLCFENTANPTDMPSVSPTSLPTSGPTSNPTKEPTTSTPTSNPTGAPTLSPTVATCEYNTISFDDGDGPAFPHTWKPYGLRIITKTDTGGIDYAYYYDTNDSDAGKGLIVKTPDSSTPTMNADGGEIIITLDMTQDKAIILKIFGASQGYTITTVLPPVNEDTPGASSFENFGPVSGSEETRVNVDGIYQIIISFQGTLVLAEMNVCRDPDRTPAPIGLASNGETFMPTQTPTKDTSNPTLSPTVDDGCPPDVILLHKKGDTPFPHNPIEVISYDGNHVTFKVKQTFQKTIGYLYTNYKKSSFETQCILLESVERFSEETFTAKCMESVHVTIVDIMVSDPSLNNVLDNAKIPECCQQPEADDHPTVMYSFEVKCDDPCPSEPARRLDEIGADAAAAADGAPKMAAETVSESDSAGKYYCKPDEHPCGDAPAMVQVCHYSSKDGYKTFCVPDKDSDIVAYYPNDSCGPCADDAEKNASVA